MAKQNFSEDLIALALQYREVTLEKYSLLIQELQSQRPSLEAISDKIKRLKELKKCDDKINQTKEMYENFKTIAPETFVKTVLVRDLLINVIKNFDKGEIEKRENELITGDLAKDIANDRQARKGQYKNMTLEQLLTTAIGNEQLESEILKVKIYNNKNAGSLSQQSAGVLGE